MARRGRPPKQEATASSMAVLEGKWPRQYAWEIYELPTREERQAALERVPEIYRPLVKKHVECFFDRDRCARQIERQEAAERRAEQGGRRPMATRNERKPMATREPARKRAVLG